MAQIITFIVSPNGAISPSTVQKAGVQGSHNVTELWFEVSELANYYADGKAKTRIQFIDGAGGFYSTGFLTVGEDKTVRCLVPSTVTNAGGIAKVYLVITKIAYEGKDGPAYEAQVFISSEAKISFEGSGVGSPSEYQYRKGISSALVNAEIFVGQAENASDAAKEYRDSAKTFCNEAGNYQSKAGMYASNAETSKENAAESATSAEKSKDSANHDAVSANIAASVAQSRAEEAANSLQELKDGIANGNFKGEKGDKGDKGDKGEKGEKGDKGDKGDPSATDQTYNPESKNAQSGIAVDMAFERVFANEETEVFDNVFVNRFLNNGLISFINGITAHSAIIPIKKFASYNIKATGTFNRLCVGLCNSTTIGEKVTLLHWNTEVSNSEEYSFTNDYGYKYLIVCLNYNSQNFDCELSVIEKAKSDFSNKLIQEVEQYSKNKNFGDNFYYTNEDVLNIGTTLEVYALYDGLMSLHPNYITKNLLGQNSLGTNIYEYVFSTGDYNSKRNVQRPIDDVIKKPVVLITSGIHGEERSAIMSTYQFFRDLANYKKTLYSLREGFVFKVVPMVCPYSFDHNQRTNENGVNINRNFNYNWVQSEKQNNINYSGDYAASELETQIIQSWFIENKDAMLYIDHHNSGYDNEVSMVIGNSAYVSDLEKQYLRGMDKVIPFWKYQRGYSEDLIFAYTGHLDVASASDFALLGEVNNMVDLFDGNFVNRTINNSQISVVSGVTSRSAIIPIEGNKTYTITATGTFNRFGVFLCNDNVINTPVTKLHWNVSPSNNEKYSFTNTEGYKYVFIPVDYGGANFNCELSVTVAEETAETIGIPSFCLETAWNQNSSGRHSPETIAVGAETLGNTLLEVCNNTTLT